MRKVIARSLLHAGAWTATHMPLRAGYAVGAAGGSVAFYVWTRGRRSTLANFRRVLPDAPAREVRGVARRSLANYGRYLVDFLRLPGLMPGDAIRLVEGEPEFAALERAAAAGRGVLVVCMHFGNWDLGAAAAVARGHRLSVVAETFTDPALDRMVVACRERLGMTVIRMETAGPSLVRTLRKNELLAILIDRPLDGEGVRVPFFGREVDVPAGPGRLALRTGALIMPVAFARIRPGSPAVRVLAAEPFEPCRTGNDAEDVRATTAAILGAHEAFIRRCPDQWYMFREMWQRTGPVG